MASRATDATIVALLVIGIIAVALLALWYLDWLLAAIIILVAVIVIGAVVLMILGSLAIIPIYFMKKGKDTQPGSYRLEQMDDLQQKERK
jgi:hypothetical protein